MDKKEKYRDVLVHEYKDNESLHEPLKVVRNLDRTHKFDSEDLCEYLLPMCQESEDADTDTSITEAKGSTSQPANTPSNESATAEISKKEPSNLNGYQLAKMYVGYRAVIMCMDNIFIHTPDKGYKPTTDRALQRDIRSVLPEDIKPYLNKYTLSEAVEFIHSDFAHKITDEVLDETTHLTAFNNCVLNTETREIYDLSPKHPIFTVLNVPYYKRRTPIFSGAWRDYLDQITGYDEEYKTVLRQVMGYLLSSYSCAKIAIFFVGLPNTGKSTLCNLIQRVVGKENTSGVPWNKLDAKFYNGTIFSKHLNISAELSSVPLKSIEYFKMLTGGDTVVGEEKYGTPFYFKYRGKLLFSGNNPPYVEELDSSDAFFDRLLLLPFMNPISPKDKNVNILDELLEDSDAIIFEALLGLKELRAQNWVFSPCKVVDDYKRDYMKEVDSVRFFVENALEKCDHSHKIFLRNLYDEYKQFCYKNCTSAYEISTFRKQIGKYGKLEEKIRIEGETLSGIRGLRFKA